MKKCSIHSSPGECEERRITHVIRHHGDVIVIENVLAEACSVCGDTLLPLSTVEAIESMLKDPGKPVKTAPVYQMPDVAAV
ncbi:MAG: YgiT-type zinc finger protein [Syntrophobacteraceae bacterium]